jgi:REP-associated tyrosine transposase
MNQKNRKSPRCPNWDYCSPGFYYVTIITKNRERFFGYIENKKMQLSENGEWAEKIWDEIPNHFPMVKLGAFVVMPDHVHGILEISKSYGFPVGIGHAVGTGHALSLQNGSLSTIIGSYKSAVTKNIRLYFPDFGWQGRFHDRIIRDIYEYHRITRYIIDNPKHYWFFGRIFAGKGHVGKGHALFLIKINLHTKYKKPTFADSFK